MGHGKNRDVSKIIPSQKRKIVNKKLSIKDKIVSMVMISFLVFAVAAIGYF